jgi:2C-methyl-D-erythritol 2,4-cyclodiphosphate synthase
MDKYPKIEFSKKAINKNINPDIKIKFDNISVKFHHNSLNKVIDFEKK